MRNLNFTEGQPISLVSLFSGIAELRTAIAKLHGFDAISPEQIIVGTGSKELIFLAMNIFHGGKYKKVTEIQISPNFRIFHDFVFLPAALRLAAFC